MLTLAIYLDTFIQFLPLKNRENNVCTPCALTDVIVVLIYEVLGSTLHINHEVSGLCPFTG